MCEDLYGNLEEKVIDYNYMLSKYVNYLQKIINKSLEYYMNITILNEIIYGFSNFLNKIEPGEVSHEIIKDYVLEKTLIMEKNQNEVLNLADETFFCSVLCFKEICINGVDNLCKNLIDEMFKNVYKMEKILSDEYDTSKMM